MQDKAPYVLPVTHRQEYSFQADLVITLPSGMDADSLFMDLVTTITSSLGNSDGRVVGSFNYKKLSNENSKQDN